jgi:hypothetical protein
LQSGWRDQLLCSDDVVHTSVCSSAMGETVYTTECHHMCVPLFPINLNLLTAVKDSAVNAVSLALFNIPCNLYSPFPEDRNRTSLCNIVLYSLALVSGQWNFQAES